MIHPKILLMIFDREACLTLIYGYARLHAQLTKVPISKPSQPDLLQLNVIETNVTGFNLNQYSIV